MVVPAPRAPAGAGTGTAAAAAVPARVPFAQVQAIVQARCVACHAEHPSQPGFATAPAGLKLEQAAAIVQNAARIEQQVVQTRAMPLANLTGITETERQTLHLWFVQGAQAQHKEQ